MTQRPQLDNVWQVETPEGICLHLHPAGPLPRAMAWAVDLIIRGVLLLALALALTALDRLGLGLFALALFATNWLYAVLFEMLNHGATPGKILLGLKVVHDDGAPLSWSGSLLRNLLRAVDSLPVGYAVGLISTLVHGQFKRLGDIAAGTLVIYKPVNLPLPDLPQVAPQGSPFTLSHPEQRAIIDFAERSLRLPKARQIEIAAPLAQALDVPDQQTPERLRAMASALVGQRA